MASQNHSFDIVSGVNLQEVSNAVDQAKKEISQRYDFKDSKSTIEWNLKDKKIILESENDFRLKALIDVLQTKMAKRGVSLKSLDYKPAEKATGGSLRQTIEIIQGLKSEKAKEIVKYIKETKIKVQAQIQEDQVRVTSAKIDNLQELIGLVKAKSFGVDLQFENYR